MIIRRIDDTTIRCILSQEDLKENQIDLDDLLEHKPRAMEYLHSIVMEAAKEEDLRFEGPITSMQVRVLRDNSICLTLSQGVKPDILKELSRAAEKIRESMPEAEISKIEACARAMSEQSGTEPDDARQGPGAEAAPPDQTIEPGAGDSSASRDVVYSMMFDSIADAVKICRSVPEMSALLSDLYRDPSLHICYLLFRGGEDAARFEQTLLELDEFGTFLELTPQTAAYIMEHHQCILKGDAAAQLMRL